MWETGIEMCKELAHLYEEELFDYKSLSTILVSNKITLSDAPHRSVYFVYKSEYHSRK